MLRVLLVGFGDIARRVALALRGRAQVYALARSPEARQRARSVGARCVDGDLDQLRKLRRIAGIADAVIHLAPPASAQPADARALPLGSDDARTRNLLAALSRRGGLPRRFVYVSTSGVYGDHGGAWVSETSPLRARTQRGIRRVAAERRVRAWARPHTERLGRVCASIVRVPGIYAAERLPLERLRAAQPVLLAAEDVYTNHIHADDLARILVTALFRGRTNRVYNATDESELEMAAYFDVVADAYGIARPPRVTRAQAQSLLSEMTLSFMSESRRLSDARMRRELRVRLRYPTVQAFLEAEGNARGVQC